MKRPTTRVHVPHFPFFWFSVCLENTQKGCARAELCPAARPRRWFLTVPRAVEVAPMPNPVGTPEDQNSPVCVVESPMGQCGLRSLCGNPKMPTLPTRALPTCVVHPAPGHEL